MDVLTAGSRRHILVGPLLPRDELPLSPARRNIVVIIVMVLPSSSTKESGGHWMGKHVRRCGHERLLHKKWMSISCVDRLVLRGLTFDH